MDLQRHGAWLPHLAPPALDEDLDVVAAGDLLLADSNQACRPALSSG